MQERKIVFVGPFADVMAISGDKVKACNAASKVVSVVQGGEVQMKSQTHRSVNCRVTIPM